MGVKRSKHRLFVVVVVGVLFVMLWLLLLGWWRRDVQLAGLVAGGDR